MMTVLNRVWPRWLIVAWAVMMVPASVVAGSLRKPNIIVILADDLGFSDLGCYGSDIQTPHLDSLAANGLRFTQFYNCARCCPTRAALLTGLYPHQAGVGHMLQAWKPPSYSTGLGANTQTIAEVLRAGRYRTYHVGKWHVGGVGGPKVDATNHPMNRGFDRAYGTGGGANYFAPSLLYLDRTPIAPDGDYYITDAFSDSAVRFLDEHGQKHKDRPFFLHLCYTAPHFPLHARPADIKKYAGRFDAGWDAERVRRFDRQKKLGLMGAGAILTPRDPESRSWNDLTETERSEWSARMSVHAAMIDCMDRGVGRILDCLRKNRAWNDTLIVFLSDNGASAEFLDTWPNPARGHKPGSELGSRDSHRCLEVGWANAANTPFREHKMWIHEGGICTPFIAHWPAVIGKKGQFSDSVGHVIDLMPTFAEIAGMALPKKRGELALMPPEGRSLLPAFRGEAMGSRQLGWEHEGNRGWRDGSWKLTGSYRNEWELYDLSTDRTECRNLASQFPDRVKAMATAWQAWADRVGVVPWTELPGSSYKPSATYRRKSERN